MAGSAVSAVNMFLACHCVCYFKSITHTDFLTKRIDPESDVISASSRKSGISSTNSLEFFPV